MLFCWGLFRVALSCWTKSEKLSNNSSNEFSEPWLGEIEGAGGLTFDKVGGSDEIVQVVPDGSLITGTYFKDSTKVYNHIQNFLFNEFNEKTTKFIMSGFP